MFTLYLKIIEKVHGRGMDLDNVLVWRRLKVWKVGDDETTRAVNELLDLDSLHFQNKNQKYSYSYEDSVTTYLINLVH
jgi:hypothetical protein